MMRSSKKEGPSGAGAHAEPNKRRQQCRRGTPSRGAPKERNAAERIKRARCVRNGGKLTGRVRGAAVEAVRAARRLWPFRPRARQFDRRKNDKEGDKGWTHRLA